MFQPHSVRGLLSRRHQTRLHSQEQMESVPSGGDPDMDSVVEAKLMIKDVEHKIEDIRQWRTNQKALLQQRLANNEAISKVQVNQYMQYLNKQEVRQNQQRQKYLKKLNLQNQVETTVPPEQWNNSDTNLFDFLANSNQLVEDSKYQIQSDNQMQLANQNFFNSMESMSQNILKRQNEKIQPKNYENNVMNKQLIKNQLEEIENQLREIEELLK